MSERFIETISTGVVIDTITGKEYKCEMRIDDEFLELVNHIDEENEQLKQSFINLIDKKIKEFQNGDYGDLPCNTIHMFLDLKEELER